MVCAMRRRETWNSLPTDTGGEAQRILYTAPFEFSTVASPELVQLQRAQCLARVAPLLPGPEGPPTRMATA